jgi:carbon-monoxide dehydrogenase large subunit
MTSERVNAEMLSALDRPNSYIGKTVARPNLDRLMQGRGLYVSDIELPRMVHVVFMRSPHAHARSVASTLRQPGTCRVWSPSLRVRNWRPS